MFAMPPSGRSGRGGKRPAGRNAQDKPGRPPSDTLFSRSFPAVLLASLTLVYFWKFLTPFSASRCWLWEDFLFQNYPYRVFAATSLAAGHFPFWNPFVFAGQPFFADIQTAVLYPFNLVQALFVSRGSLSPYLVQAVELLHYFLAAIFTFRFLRLGEASREGALLGAVTFAFSGFMVTHAIHMNFIYVFVWLPLILELFERALSGSRFRHVLACALVLALSNMGGYPQYSLYIYCTLGLYWLVQEFARHGADGWSQKNLLRRLVILAFVSLAALGLNTFAYLPAAELARYTPRSEMTYAASTEHSLNPLFLFKLISPRFFGVQYPGTNSYWAGGYSAFWETCLFAGSLPLILALSSLGALRKNRHLLFAALLGALCLWLALGNYGLLYKLFFSYAPGFDRFRIPGRFSALVSFALALLAAHGWTRLTAQKEKTAARFFSSGPAYITLGLMSIALTALILLKTGALDNLSGAALADPVRKAAAAASLLASLSWLALSGSLIFLAVTRPGASARAGLGIAACLLVFAELYWFGAPFLKGDTAPDQLYQYNQTVAAFQQEGKKELFRINARSLENPGIMLLGRNQGSLHRLFLLEGYNPLQLKRRLAEIEKERRFDLLNVKYMIAIDYEHRTAGFVQRKTYLPRAFLLRHWRVAGEDEKILAALNGPDFNYRGEAILETDPGIDTPAAGSHIESKVEITSYEQNEIEISTVSDIPGILVLSEWDYPAWKAWVDGEPAKVLRADYALRAVALREGSHKVRFAYRSASFDKGLLLSLLTALILLAAFIVFSVKGRF
ncbi:MAG: hypothetical protein A3F83_06450 [Candidatus Glassbacteria bacterium RIFCSPLOWO2_12_FULL_58_11]|uniref:Membrane protein 6-pyruvoyl-tetrahydropterin synthase-related domain-containing protein n=1 Tax=Candidatus Glassbacteria bacterium RIFCSPLOWO2_12_FULL_58_11 TaxID=1817867 RepID=A0A1F5YM40_9BACT|nr:MAG: hypothetical protein A3F83_06450 [Candidatus Glassbacteria bacterium RIFCSPLOWO2_12_FULL_58_11]